MSVSVSVPARLGAYYFAFFAYIGVVAPYLSLWLADRGYGAPQIAFVLAMPQLARIFAPTLWGWIADRTGWQRGIVVFTAFSTLTGLSALHLTHGWAERHMGLPQPIARIVTGNTIRALRQYFLGVTIVAAFNGIVIGLGALILVVPLAGTITVVTFVCAYVPFIGAWTAGAFAVLLALSGVGESAAVAMIVIVALANGTLQQIVQPIAFGATLDMHPLAILIVTIAAGSLFGTIGLVLAAPLTSAALRVSGDLARARARATTS